MKSFSGSQSKAFNGKTDIEKGHQKLLKVLKKKKLKKGFSKFKRPEKASKTSPGSTTE
jgi:hypothetical protein